MRASRSEYRANVEGFQCCGRTAPSYHGPDGGRGARRTLVLLAIVATVLYYLGV